MPQERDASRSAEQPADESARRPAETAWQRRRRLALVFGGGLPETPPERRSPRAVVGVRRRDARAHLGRARPGGAGRRVGLRRLAARPVATPPRLTRPS